MNENLLTTQSPRRAPSPGKPGEGRVRALLRMRVMRLRNRALTPTLSRSTGRGRNALVAFLAILFCSFADASAQSISITDRGVRNVDNVAVDQHGKEFPIRGLSGITWLGGDDFLAVMD